MLRLTDATIRNLPSPATGQKTHFDDALRGFGIRISQGGTRTFVLMYGADRQLLSIGRYPVISLADARAEAKRLLAEKTLGKRQPQSITYERAVALFLEDKAQECRPGTVSEYKRLLAVHFPFHGQLAAITHADFERKLKRVDALSERNHALAAAKTFFTWALKHRYITENPTVAYSLVGRPSRSRVLSDDELKRVWKAAKEMGANFGTIVELLILTGQRRGEIAALQTPWLNLADKTITLPAEITKNKREHSFPIGQSAASLISNFPTEASAPVIFPARGKSSTPFNGWSKSKVALDKLSGVTGWTLHDIRRTVASNLAALGVALPVIERLLNHVSGSFGGIVSVYQRHSFMPEMRAAVEKWNNRVLDILAS